jgi:hypothetical protein
MLLLLVASWTVSAQEVITSAPMFQVGDTILIRMETDYRNTDGSWTQSIARYEGVVSTLHGDTVVMRVRHVSDPPVDQRDTFGLADGRVAGVTYVTWLDGLQGSITFLGSSGRYISAETDMISSTLLYINDLRPTPLPDSVLRKSTLGEFRGFWDAIRAKIPDTVLAMRSGSVTITEYDTTSFVRHSNDVSGETSKRMTETATITTRWTVEDGAITSEYTRSSPPMTSRTTFRLDRQHLPPFFAAEWDNTNTSQPLPFGLVGMRVVIERR